MARNLDRSIKTEVDDTIFEIGKDRKIQEEYFREKDINADTMSPLPC